MALENLTKDDIAKIQCVSSAGNAMFRLCKLDNRLELEAIEVLSALAKCDERLQSLYPSIYNHFEDVKRRHLV